LEVVLKVLECIIDSRVKADSRASSSAVRLLPPATIASIFKIENKTKICRQLREAPAISQWQLAAAR